MELGGGWNACQMIADGTFQTGKETRLFLGGKGIAVAAAAFSLGLWFLFRVGCGSVVVVIVVLLHVLLVAGPTPMSGAGKSNRGPRSSRRRRSSLTLLCGCRSSASSTISSIGSFDDNVLHL